MLLLLSLETASFFKYQSDVDALRVRHEKQSIVACNASDHAQTVEVDRFEIECVLLGAHEDLDQRRLPHEVVLLVSRGRGCLRNSGVTFAAHDGCIGISLFTIDDLANRALNSVVLRLEGSDLLLAIFDFAGHV